jgi:hypothetical protein
MVIRAMYKLGNAKVDAYTFGSVSIIGIINGLISAHTIFANHLPLGFLVIEICFMLDGFLFSLISLCNLSLIAIRGCWYYRVFQS